MNKLTEHLSNPQIKLTATDKVILSALADGASARLEDIAQRTGSKFRWMSKWASTLTSMGILQRVAPGTYALASQGAGAHPVSEHGLTVFMDDPGRLIDADHNFAGEVMVRISSGEKYVGFTLNYKEAREVAGNLLVQAEMAERKLQRKVVTKHEGQRPYRPAPADAA